MTENSSTSIHYKRARFSTYLPKDRLYSSSHFWLKEMDECLWRVGFTKFATRMLGEIVEFDLDTKPGNSVVLGEVIGRIEALKAVSDIYCIGEGAFDQINPELYENPTLITSFPYDQGWLYQIRGKPDPKCLDVFGYVSFLNTTIDRLQAKENA